MEETEQNEDNSESQNADSSSDTEVFITPTHGGAGFCCGFWHKLLIFIRAINVEPALFIFSIHTGIMQTLQQPFLYYRKCLDIYYHKVPHVREFCHHLSDFNTTAAEDVVSYDVSNLSIYISVATCLPAVLMCPVIGAWSDASGGRKRPILIALAGVSLYDVVYLLCISLHEVSLYWLLLGCFISSLAGQQMIIYAVGFALITDDARSSITKRNQKRSLGTTHSSDPIDDTSAILNPCPETQTQDAIENYQQGKKALEEIEIEKLISTRISIGSGIVAFGIVLGSLILSWFRSDERLHSHSYIYSVLVAEGSVALAFLYTLFVVQEDPKHGVIPKRSPNEGEPARTRRLSLCSKGIRACRLIKKRLRASLQTLIAPRPGYRRACLLLSLVLHSLFTCWYYGTESIILLFVKRDPFKWSDTLYGYYLAYLQALGALGMLVFPPLIQLCVSSQSLDTTIILLGIFNSCAFYLTLGFSNENWMLWFGGSFVLLADLDEPGFSALYSKLVSEEETARVFIMMAIVQNVSPILGTALFNSVYSQTVADFPGFAFVLAGSLHVPVILGISFVHHILRREGGESDTQVEGCSKPNEEKESTMKEEETETNGNATFSNDTE